MNPIELLFEPVSKTAETERVPWVTFEIGTCTEGKERLNEEAGHSRLVSGSFNGKGHLHRRLVLGGCKMSRYLQTLARILKVYIET